MKKIYISLILSLLTVLTSLGQDSLNMKRLSSWTKNIVTEYNDCWGYTDSLGREFVILGSDWGTHFIDVTDPENPDEISSFEGLNKHVIWRDFKTKGHYAYGVADDYGNSLQIFDLSGLPDYVEKIYDLNVWSESSHNIFIEGERAYLCSNRRNDTVYALDVLSLEDPENPFLIASFGSEYFGGCNGCIHDIYVKDNIAYCSAGYNGMYIYDLSDLQNPVLLGSITTYSSSGYNHSSWVHEDGDIMVMADEVPNSLPLKTFDISDYDAPVELNVFISDTTYKTDTAVSGPRPHNPFFLKNELYVSYYYDGLQVFDFTDPANPYVSAYYDTYMNNDTISGDIFPNNFNGAWGTYPYFDSKNIPVADITYGLVMVTKVNDVYTNQEKVSVCDNPNSTISIDFTAKGEFNAGNTFYLESADTDRSFIDAVRIDSLSIDSAGEYSFTFDPSGYSQNNFRFRVGSTDPNIHQGGWLDLDYSSTPSVPEITQLGDTLSVADNAEYYRWYRNGNQIIGADGAMLITNQVGDYYVEAYNGGCKSTSNQIILLSNKVKIEEIKVDIFPNPTTGVVNISRKSNEKLNITVYDARGAEIRSLKSNKQLISLNLDEGLYVIQLSSKNAVKTAKVIVY